MSATPTPQTTPPQPRIAGMLRRLMALVYDGLLLIAISVAYAALILTARVLLTDVDRAQEPLTGIFRYLLLLGWWASLSLFYCWCWRRTGQTLGMKTWRLQLQNLQGGAPTWKQCWLRCLVAPLTLVAFGIGYLWCLVNSRGDALQDQLTGTQVMVLPKLLKSSELSESSKANK